MGLLSLCNQCHKYIAISPEGLCNICDEEALQKRKAALQEKQEDKSDLAYLGEMNRKMREERKERFEPWIEELKQSPKIISMESNEQLGKHTINTEEFGIVDYFPKANKLLIRKDNEWIKPGLSWIRKNLL